MTGRYPLPSCPGLREERHASGAEDQQHKRSHRRIRRYGHAVYQQTKETKDQEYGRQDGQNNSRVHSSSTPAVYRIGRIARAEITPPSLFGRAHDVPLAICVDEGQESEPETQMTQTRQADRRGDDRGGQAPEHQLTGDQVRLLHIWPHGFVRARHSGSFCSSWTNLASLRRRRNSVSQHTWACRGGERHHESNTTREKRPLTADWLRCVGRTVGMTALESTWLCWTVARPAIRLEVSTVGKAPAEGSAGAHKEAR